MKPIINQSQPIPSDSPPDEPPPFRSVFLVAPPDPYAVRVTMGVAYLGGLLLLPLLFSYLSNMRWGGLLIPTTLALLLALALTLAYAGQPTTYTIDGEHLIIARRWLWRVRIPLKEIAAASAAPSLARIPQHGLRFAFNPGLFGYQGPFYLAPFGQAFLLATNRELLVSIARHSDRPLVLSPLHPRRLIDTLNARPWDEQPDDEPPDTL